jgi:predicted small metal-binding protein
MAKILHCRDAGFDCDAVVRGDTVEDILAQVRPHAREVHRVEVDDAMGRQLATLVADA